MAVTTKILFPATSNSTTTDFSLSGLQLNNQDDLDVYVTKPTAGIAANNNKRILHNRQSTSSNVDANHKQVNDTTGLYFPAITHTGGTETLENYTLINNNGTVHFNGNGLPQGSIVFVERRTRDADSSYTSFASGSTIRATDLNNSSTESNFTAQEARNKALTIEGVLFDGDQPSTNFVTSSHIVDGSVTTNKLANDAVTNAKLADNAVVTENIVDGQVDAVKLNQASGNEAVVTNAIRNSAVTSSKIADNAVTTTEILNGAVTTAKINNSAVTTAKIADANVTTAKLAPNNVTTAKIAPDAIDSSKIADNAVGSEHYQDGSIDRVHLEADIIDSTKLADNAVGSEHIQTNAVTDSEIATGTLDNRYFTETELTNGALDGRYFTETESDARYFNISSGETIKDGDTFPDNDTTIATTAAINDRIIDLIDDVGGFDIIQSEQHFPNTNPQGVTGQSAVLSIKAASTNLVPSGTTVTISNGNLANNANITITGVTSTIPTGFGFLVESTSTTHTYAFHRLVPKATEVTTVAGNITNINAAANNESNINAAVSNASNINAAVSNASNINAAVSNASNINSAVSNASNINAAVSNASNINTTASNITNVNNVGNNITNVNSVSNSAGANQTFTVTVQNVSGNKYFIDGAQTPVLKLARGKTYTFDMSDSSNSGHPLAFRDSSDNSYTTGVTTSGTAGSSGATVVIVVAANAPSSLKYYCTSHGNSMGNTITVIDDNVGTVAGSISNVNTVGGAISNVNTTAGSISNVNTVASNISNVNSFFNVYRIGSQNPTSSLDTGDLFFNTTSNSLKVYTGSAWVDGVTATGNFAVVTGNTFTGSNNHNDNVKSIYGTGSDLEIFHNGTHSLIENSTGHLILRTDNELKLQNGAGTENMAKFIADGAVELYYDFSKKLETTSDGVVFTGAARFVGNETAFLTGKAHPTLYRTASTSGSYPFNDFGHLVIQSRNDGSNRDIIFATGSNSSKLNRITSAGHLDLFGDGQHLRLGASQDLQLFHDSANSYIDNATGNFEIRTDEFRVKSYTGSNEAMIQSSKDGNVQLYFDNSIKLATNPGGVLLYDNLRMGDYHIELNDNAQLMLGNAPDFRIYHDGSHSYVQNNTGDLFIKSNADDLVLQAADDVLIRPQNGDNGIKVIGDGSVELYHNNAKKFETISSGVQVSGTLFIPDGSSSSNRISVGNSGDLNIYHNGSDSIIRGGDPTVLRSNLLLLKNYDNSDSYIRCTNSGNVEVYYDNSKKIETLSTGVNITGNLGFNTTSPTSLIDARATTGATIQCSNTSSNIGKIGINVGSNENFVFSRGATTNDKRQLTFMLGNSIVAKFTTGQNYIPGADSTHDLGSNTVRWRRLYADTLYGDGSNLTGINTDLVSDTSPQLGANLDCNGHEINLDDGKAVRMGDGFDFQIYHNTGTSYINASSSGNTSDLTVMSYGNTRFKVNGGSETALNLISNGGAELYYNNAKKLETKSGGVDIFGQLAMGDDNKHTFGNGDDLEIYHDGANSVIREVGTGALYIGGDTIYLYGSGTGETMLRAFQNGATELYYDNSKKFETTSNGCIVSTGDIRFTNSSWTGEANDGKIQNHGGVLYIQGGSHGSYGILFRDNGGTDRWGMTQSGHLTPIANNTYDIGSSGYRVRNIYTNDLHLSNKGHQNDVDGTWGDWTIQEGESDLFLKNNRSGKKFKFNLTEVS